MKQKGILGLVVLLLSLLPVPSAMVLAEEGPVVDLTSIWIWPAHDNNEQDMKWIPQMQFNLTGVVADGSVFWVEYAAPGGAKPWFTTECQHSWDGSNTVATVKCENRQDDKTSSAAGVIPFKIGMKNELQGKNLTLFSGHFKTGRHHVGNDHPNFKKNFGYYIDYDWTVPIGYLYPNTHLQGKVVAETSPYLMASVWFRYRYETTEELGAYVFYQGKQVCKSENNSEGSPSYVTRSGFKPSVHGYYRTNFYLPICRLSIGPYDHGDWFDMSKNPGEYELKVLRNGKLARGGKFTVGADGKVLSTAAVDSLHTMWHIIPVQILGDQDGKWDKKAWQTEAFYGNPLQGFQGPQTAQAP